MKNLFTIFSCFLMFYVNAQNTNYISKQIEKQIRENSKLEKISLFNTSADRKVNDDLLNNDPNATILHINQVELDKILDFKPELVEISIPYNNTITTVVLIKNNFLPSDFIAKTNRGEIISYDPGVYYKGIIKDENSSFVTFSFFENDIIGIITDKQSIALSVVKNERANNFISYSNFFDEITTINCGNDNASPAVIENNSNSTSIGIDNCVQIFYEIGYTDFLLHNSNLAETLNWITATHNSVSALFFNENIVNLIISEVYIWQQQDPYKAILNRHDRLNFFKNYRNTYRGNLAHLISSDAADAALGGVGYLAGLCNSSSHALTIAGTVNVNVIKVMSHEIGHNLSSPHTHACFWNGNNTAIDGCGAIEGGNCPNPGSPSAGTIMSYCNINTILFEFGEQPATLMRNYVASVSCLHFNCSFEQFQILTEVNDVNAGIISQSGSGNYFSGDFVSLNVTPYPGYIFLRLEKSRLNSNVTTILFENSQQFYIDDNYTFQAIFQYVGFPTGDNFTVNVFSNPNQGGVTTGSGSYSVGSNYTVTATANVGYDFHSWSIVSYNNSTVTFPPISTFTIPVQITGGGDGVNWVANFTPTLSTNENHSTSNNFKIFPNPVSNIITISVENQIINQVSIYDITGRLLKTENANGSTTTINLESLPNAIYLMEVTTNLSRKTEKIIKK